MALGASIRLYASPGQRISIRDSDVVSVADADSGLALEDTSLETSRLLGNQKGTIQPSGHILWSTLMRLQAPQILGPPPESHSSSD